MRTIVWLPIAALSLSFSACDKKDDAGTTSPSTKSTGSAIAVDSAGKPLPKSPENIKRLDFPGTQAGAKALLEAFLKPGADQAGMTKSLRPSLDDYDTIFVADAATNVKAKYEEQWNRNDYKITAKEGQTELLLWQATTEELRDGTVDAKQFPGGYKKIADKLKPGLTFYRFKFVKPGDKHGMAFDGLVYVNGHWVMVSKPYRAM